MDWQLIGILAAIGSLVTATFWQIIGMLRGDIKRVDDNVLQLHEKIDKIEQHKMSKNDCMKDKHEERYYSYATATEMRYTRAMERIEEIYQKFEIEILKLGSRLDKINGVKHDT